MSEYAKQFDAIRDWDVFVVRIVTGVILIAAGYGKLFATGLEGVSGFFGQAGMAAPYFFALVAGVLEFFGGIAVLAGLFTR